MPSTWTLFVKSFAAVAALPSSSLATHSKDCLPRSTSPQFLNAPSNVLHVTRSSPKDNLTWSALLTGYARQGDTEHVLHLFDKARKTAVLVNCYVMASYASFLWDVEDNEETTPVAPPPPAYGPTPPASSPLLASA
ncbi:hypothetical protein GOP47_0015498 [Adiantum capillus-veneris]|uniref:Pentatricopeptide repeat-containing protein n=1 Tax=Adiantum capillus-veneris TaxID=13818 RepID=A0A9D4UK45_ADICA|nr:hypothetical protein GOP47_0015498 [Adiantum capillus-veneris]